MRIHEGFDLLGRDIDAVVEDAIKKKAAAVGLRLLALEVDPHGIDPKKLLGGVRRALADGDDQGQQLGVRLRDLREQLDEIEGPNLTRLTARVAQAVEPSLELVEKKSGRLRLEHLQEHVLAGDLGAGSLPLALCVLSLGVFGEQDVP